MLVAGLRLQQGRYMALEGKLNAAYENSHIKPQIFPQVFPQF